MTYTELCAAIANYTENTFTATELATFTKQAEQRIYNTVQLADLRKNVTGTLTANNKYLSAPDDFLSVYSLAVYPVSGGDYVYLLDKDVSFIREVYPSPTYTAMPKYYAIFGPQSANVNELTFILGPTPNTMYMAELHYYYYPPSIVTSGSTWLGDNFDTALLYGCLIEAYTFMKGEQDLLTLYDGKYKEALLLLKNLGDGKQRMDTYRDGQVKIPVS
jgi:hypothetical protein